MQGRFLSSGKFATVRTIKVADMAISFDNNSGLLAMCVLASRCALIDDQPLTAQQFLDMDHLEAVPIFHMLNRQLSEVHETIQGKT